LIVENPNVVQLGKKREEKKLAAGGQFFEKN